MLASIHYPINGRAGSDLSMFKLSLLWKVQNQIKSVCPLWYIHTWNEDRDNDENKWVVWYCVETFTLHINRDQRLRPIVRHYSGPSPCRGPGSAQCAYFTSTTLMQGLYQNNEKKSTLRIQRSPVIWGQILKFWLKYHISYDCNA